MSNKIAMALLIALAFGATSTAASAAVSAPWPPPPGARHVQVVPGYGYAVTKGKHERTNHAPPQGEAHGSR